MPSRNATSLQHKFASWRTPRSLDYCRFTPFSPWSYPPVPWPLLPSRPSEVAKVSPPTQSLSDSPAQIVLPFPTPKAFLSGGNTRSQRSVPSIIRNSIFSARRMLAWFAAVACMRVVIHNGPSFIANRKQENPLASSWLDALQVFNEFRLQNALHPYTSDQKTSWSNNLRERVAWEMKAFACFEGYSS